MLILSSPILSQNVKGRLIDNENHILSNLSLTLFAKNRTYQTISSFDGSFLFDNILSMDNESIPSGYFISNNYPNPFNPITRIMVTLPSNGNVKISTYNLLGEKVISDISKELTSGSHSIDLELNGLPNGVYFANVSINDRFTIVKKMMLLYGSQHLFPIRNSANAKIVNTNKNTETIIIDSLIVSSKIIGKKVFDNLPSINGSSLDLGDIIIERFCPGLPTIVYEGKNYNTIQIGVQFWLKENLDIGRMILGDSNPSDNRVIEKYSYENDTNNSNIYGGLYQWNEAMQYSTKEGTKGICPSGWHIPTKAEFEKLIETVDYNSDYLKAFSGNDNSNMSGFSALIAGHRNTDGIFRMLENNTSFWLSSEYFTGDAYYVYLRRNNSEVTIDFSKINYAFSIRCIKD